DVSLFNCDADRRRCHTLGNGRNVVNLTPCIRIKIRIKDHHAVANNQETVNWKAIGPHIVEGFGQHGGIETPALGARRLPCDTWKLLGSSPTTLSKEQKQQTRSEKRAWVPVRHHIEGWEHVLDSSSISARR